MWHITIFICFFLINLNLSLLITKNKFANNRQIQWQSRDNPGDVSSCSSQTINIDTLRNKLDINDQEQIGISSSWKRVVAKTDEDESEETDDDSPSLNNIQVIFDIPDPVSNGSILNQTVFITDAIHNQLIGSLANICIHASSFMINYSTNKSLPHNVCLYLLLNLTSSITLKEIIICRTINKNFSVDHHGMHDNHIVGPSAIFIILQGVISCLMMLIICMVHIDRNKHFVNRITQQIFHKKPSARTSNTGPINLESTNEKLPIQEQVLTSIHNDRKYTNHNLIDITEFTRRLSLSQKYIESNSF